MLRIIQSLSLAAVLLASAAGGTFAFNPDIDENEPGPGKVTVHHQAPNNNNEIEQAQGPVSSAYADALLTKDVLHLVAKQAAFKQCMENNSPVNLALVCRDFRDVVKREMEVNKPCWKAWYGVIGHEEVYERFLNGVLIYRPSPQSDEGMKVFRIRDLPNPLDAEFDLKECGDAGQYVSVMTGLRKGRNPAHQNKFEVLVAPRFLAQKKRGSSAQHLAPVLDAWSREDAALVGLFFTDGNWENNAWFDYLTSASLDAISARNLLDRWRLVRPAHWLVGVRSRRARVLMRFHVCFLNRN